MGGTQQLLRLEVATDEMTAGMFRFIWDYGNEESYCVISGNPVRLCMYIWQQATEEAEQQTCEKRFSLLSSVLY